MLMIHHPGSEGGYCYSSSMVGVTGSKCVATVGMMVACIGGKQWPVNCCPSSVLKRIIKHINNHFICKHEHNNWLDCIYTLLHAVIRSMRFSDLVIGGLLSLSRTTFNRHCPRIRQHPNPHVHEIAKSFLRLFQISLTNPHPVTDRILPETSKNQHSENLKNKEQFKGLREH